MKIFYPFSFLKFQTVFSKYFLELLDIHLSFDLETLKQKKSVFFGLETHKVLLKQINLFVVITISEAAKVSVKRFLQKICL